jgi:hypothetical protein
MREDLLGCQITQWYLEPQRRSNHSRKGGSQSGERRG